MAQFGPELFWFPDGTIAANVEVRVFPRNSNALAPIFTDAGLTVPLANPTTTDGAGMLTFYAANGDYWVYVNDLAYPYTLISGGDGTWHAVVIHTQSIAADPWTVIHNMGTQPNVTVVSPANDVLTGVQVTYTSLSQLSIDFGSPQTGTAYLRR